MKKNLLLLFISIFFIVIILEAFLRIFYPINLQSYYAEIIDKNKNFVALKKNHYHKMDRWNKKYFASYSLGNYRNRITQLIKKI